MPDDLAEEAGDDDTIILSGACLASYQQTLGLLAREPDFRDLTARDIDADLWRLVCELTIGSKEYRIVRNRRQRITRFLDHLRRPLKSYEVIAVIEHLKIGGSGVTVGGVCIKHLTEKATLKWFNEPSLTSDAFIADFANHQVAIVTTKAASVSRAVEKAQIEIDDALHLLRYSLITSGGAADERMLFARSEAMAGKVLASGTVEQVSLQRTFSPIDWPLDRGRVQRLGEAIARVEGAAFQEKPSELSLRLRRAIHWIGSSITREQPDDKVVDLCTALEALLTSRGERLKGEAVAVRNMLLAVAIGQGAPSGPLMYELYNLRSEIVHGAAIRVVSQAAYERLLWIACVVATHFADLLHHDHSLSSFSALIATIQKSVAIEQVISILRRQGGRHSQRLIRYAENLAQHDVNPI